MSIEVGQGLALKIRFNNKGDAASSPHPYLVVAVHDMLGIIEIAQMDSLAGKEHKAAFKSNKVIFCNDPIETVIDRDSYVQLDNTIQLENFSGIEGFRRQTDKLSKEKLEDVLNAYRNYHEVHEIDEMKNVYMDKNEILSLNKRYRKEPD